MPKLTAVPPGVATMTEKQYNAALKSLGLTIVGAGRRFGMGQRRAQRVAAGDATVPPPLAILLRVMVKHGIKVEDLDSYA